MIRHLSHVQWLSVVTTLMFSTAVQAEPHQPSPLKAWSVHSLNTFGLDSDNAAAVLTLAHPLALTDAGAFFESSVERAQSIAGVSIGLNERMAIVIGLNYQDASLFRTSKTQGLSLSDVNQDGLPDTSINAVTSQTLSDTAMSDLATFVNFHATGDNMHFAAQLGLSINETSAAPNGPLFFAPIEDPPLFSTLADEVRAANDLATDQEIGRVRTANDANLDISRTRYWLGLGFAAGEEINFSSRIFAGLSSYDIDGIRQVTQTTQQDTIEASRDINEQIREAYGSIDFSGEIGLRHQYGYGVAWGATFSGDLNIYQEPSDFLMQATDIRKFGGGGAGVASLDASRIYRWSRLETDRVGWEVGASLYHTKEIGGAEVGVAASMTLQEQSDLQVRRMFVNFRDEVDQGDAQGGAGDYFLSGEGSISVDGELRQQTQTYQLGAFAMVPISEEFFLVHGGQIQRTRVRTVNAITVTDASPVVGTRITALNTTDTFVEPLTADGVPVATERIEVQSNVAVRSGMTWVLADTMQVASYIGLRQILQAQTEPIWDLGFSTAYEF